MSSWTSSIDTTWELFRHEDAQIPPQTTEPETLRGPVIWVLIRSSGDFENHWSDGKCSVISLPQSYPATEGVKEKRECKVAGKLSVSFLDSLLVSLPTQATWYFCDVIWCMESQTFLLTRITEGLFIYSVVHLVILRIFVEHLYQALFQACWCSGKKDKHYPCSSGVQSQNDTSEYKQSQQQNNHKYYKRK